MTRPSYISILACPLCHGKLHMVKEPNPELWCKFDGLAFPIINDIPIMLEHEARQLTTEEKLRKNTKS